ncbi:hypothetical protein [Sphingobacterium sp. JB170]|uniref:hypothetical protein n=1 Tax=Sphingobacterium sp. JB170 TaxID=1434842 RepID=UPI00097F400F|nr:hypothetical protein [Sphingobacterium sp. JB170]SJN48857.1 hypothetical protein FM107_17790 [Sphingobacterium sp. JB170]
MFLIFYEFLKAFGIVDEYRYGYTLNYFTFLFNSTTNNCKTGMIPKFYNQRKKTKAWLDIQRIE